MNQHMENTLSHSVSLSAFQMDGNNFFFFKEKTLKTDRSTF